MAKKVYALKSIIMGDVHSDGGMGQTLTEVFGETVLGSATLTVDKPTKTGVKTEEKKNSIFFIDGEDPDFTLNASTYNISAKTMKKLFGGTISGPNGVQTLGTIVGGTGYANGVYKNVPLSGGTGFGASADITVSGGVVTAITILGKGVDYTAADTLSAPAALLGGTGSGFTVPVSALYAGAESWSAPIGGVKATLEQSVIAESQTGIKFKFVKMDISSGLAVSFDKTKLGQIDYTGLLMEPDKANTPAWGIDWPA
ncbi:hypothetical protein [Pedobacter sp. Leaf170]|uniref:hypothetical protein n=1 Tax=Pedobacter sp. Leaf170 TaxID=2876558 RepID=UPI001E4180CE|nr:hypothetical protein [Pedobacter sp. Leaf170]